MPETAPLPTFDQTMEASLHRVQDYPHQKTSHADRVFEFLLLSALLTLTGVWIYFLARAFWAAAVWIAG